MYLFGLIGKAGFRTGNRNSSGGVNPMLNRKMLRMLVTGVAVLMLAAGSALASSFNFPYPAKMGDALLESGLYNVSWEQHSPAVIVTVAKGKKVVTTAAGRMESRPGKFAHNMVVYTKHPDGSQSISELRIKGTNSAIVFDK